MKKALLIIACIFSLYANAQEKINTFHLIDEDTRKPVPSVSVAIIRAGLSITTEKDGVFAIPGDLDKMRDTVILYVQNYAERKIQLHLLNGLDTLWLKKLPGPTVSNIRVNVKADTLLNDYRKEDVGYYTGLHSGDSPFGYLQLAQQFTVAKEGTILKNVTIHRLAFNLNYDWAGGRDRDPYQNRYTELEHTKFRIRVYDIDPATGAPGKDLCNETIEIKDRDESGVGTNLKTYNIIIPHKTFFIAVEWLRDYYNMTYTRVYNADYRKIKKLTNYRPSIGISPIKGDKLNIWALNLKHEWKPFTDYSPDFTDLAIKAVIKY
ncbi:hypothetical protein [Mucilaginibacter sp. UYCu711]|uniref:hypothetical protein n=1 Tax=Mucilaginibacter sp. UYCu711 TaxID=3156339 RepID=UPI003D1B6B57